MLCPYGNLVWQQLFAEQIDLGRGFLPSKKLGRIQTQGKTFAIYFFSGAA
jgi:hypothetical protein